MSPSTIAISRNRRWHPASPRRSRYSHAHAFGRPRYVEAKPADRVGRGKDAYLAERDRFTEVMKALSFKYFESATATTSEPRVLLDLIAAGRDPYQELGDDWDL